jgi:hypothetical protein
MSSVLEAIAAIRRDERSAVDEVALPEASDAGITLALQLRETPSVNGGRVVLFVPTLRSADVSPAACDAVCGLVELHDGPVLIVDLRSKPSKSTTPRWLAGLEVHEQVGALWKAETASDRAVVWRPLADRSERAFCAAPGQVAARLKDARERYPYILCIGDAVPMSLATLMVAGLADGVVLSVAAGRVTKPEVQGATAHLRRARAKLMGFVVDSRGLSKGDRQ